MKDFNGNELVVGDYVAFLEPNYRHMIQGRVAGFTPKTIRIEYLSSYNRRRGFSIQEQSELCNREPSYVAKIEPVDKVAETVL